MTQTMTAAEVVKAARSDQKVTGPELINGLVTDFFELHGDRLGSDDLAIIGGIGRFHEQPLTVIATNRGATPEEKMATHFGCPSPGGYRKARRLMEQAAHFHRPVLCLVNTPGAYPGQTAEENGQGAAIAQNLLTLSQLPVPVLTVIFGEGGSGGALALAGGDEVWMLAHSTYSILSPEGFASILWKDSRKAPQAAELMQLTPTALKQAGIIEGIIPEPRDHQKVIAAIDKVIAPRLHALQQLAVPDLLAKRQQRYRQF
ncbi:acetyl-CoA carboxylase carboxyltransferase subunit alpha [Limosilactobacillus ingluviei]|uniref:acetyl-CoA carboxylase carboxyltransferase subunit alpha n=1 Tax=Limosilactobacillus ingluviei TaxID=148604 RepID=UPI0024BB3DA8|nr:carboxyltransferase subunit alpha [Limosilactobacillus ingluviei]